MRILSGALGVLGGLAGLVFAWFLLAITMMAGGGKPWLAQIFLVVVAAGVIASVLCIVGGLLDPKRPISLRLLLASGAIWIVCALVAAVATLIVGDDQTRVIAALKFGALVALQAGFPLLIAALGYRQARGDARPSA